MGGICVTGLFISNYGQFLFAWQSGHFDGLMSTRLSVRTYIKSKFVLFTTVCTLILIFSTFYGLLSWKILLIQLAAYFYNIGLHTVIVIYFATRSYKPIDITRKAAFNYQGLGAAQWLYTLFVFLVPLAIYLPFSFLAGRWWAILAVGLVGLINLLLRDWWIDWLTRQFNRRKYLILEGFREK
jgi:xanthine/uracil/vitamin C permease (AzgA family)